MDFLCIWMSTQITVSCFFFPGIDGCPLICVMGGANISYYVTMSIISFSRFPPTRLCASIMGIGDNNDLGLGKADKEDPTMCSSGFIHTQQYQQSLIPSIC